MTQVKTVEELLAKLKSVLLRQRVIMFSAGLLGTTAIVLAVWIMLSLLASVMIVPVWLKITLLALAMIISLVGFGRLALRRLFDGSIAQVASSLEDKQPGLKGRLMAAIEFAREKQTHGASAELVELTILQAVHKAGTIELNSVLSFHPLFKSSRYLAVSTVIALAMLLFIPGLFTNSFNVYSNPTTEIAPPLGYEIEPLPGSTQWIKYRDIEIGAYLLGGSFPEKATIHYRLMEGSWQQSKIDLSKTRRFSIDAGDSVTASLTLRQINRSFDYYVEAGRVKTELQHIDVVDRPRVTAIKLSVFYPDYTGLDPIVIDENNGSFSAVVGSRVNLRIESNPKAQSAELVFDDSSRTQLDMQGNAAETSLSVYKSRSYYIRLKDHLGEKNPDPIEYYVTAVPDEYPSVDVIRPGFNLNLTDEMSLPIKLRIFDDYGFSSLALKYTLVSQGAAQEENVAILNFSDRIKTEGDVNFNWDLDRLNMFPGDYVSYHFEVADNDQISGPKVTSSKEYIVRLPSLDEIIAETDAESSERITKTEEVLRQGRDLNERLKQSARKLDAQNKNQGKADWQQQKEMEDIAKQSEQLFKEIEDISKTMEKSLDKMSEQSLMSREIMEKLAQIQKLFEEVATPEMKEAQKRLMEALEDMNRKELSDAADDLEQTQKEMMERLERTLSLLKKMQVMQKMEEMTRRVEELAQKQEQMNDKTESSEKADLPKLSDDESKLKEEMEKLKKDAEDLDELIKDAEMSDSKEAKEFSESVKKSSADKNMQKMSENLSQSEKQSATDEGKEALSKLMEMLDNMQQQMMAMKGADEEEFKRKMRLAMEQSNDLSMDQETMLRTTASVSPRSGALQDMAPEQKELAVSAEGLKRRVAELGKASPFIAAELEQLVTDAISNMETAVEKFSEKRGHQAQAPQRTAMTDLNKISLRLMESMQAQKECKNGSQCSNPMQQLESMCDKQNSLNQKSKKECNKPGNSSGDGKEGQGSREALQRLAQEQNAIRKSMEQLSQEFGGSRQLLGRLDDIAKEMKKVEEALESGETGPEMNQRQLKIYSRMLEASRSLQRKDYSEQRRATTSDSQAIYLPPSLTTDLLNDKTKLEDRLKQFMGEGYPKQYEEQVKAYFKALLQSEVDGQSTRQP